MIWDFWICTCKIAQDSMAEIWQKGVSSSQLQPRELEDKTNKNTSAKGSLNLRINENI